MFCTPDFLGKMIMPYYMYILDKSFLVLYQVFKLFKFRQSFINILSYIYVLINSYFLCTKTFYIPIKACILNKKYPFTDQTHLPMKNVNIIFLIEKQVLTRYLKKDYWCLKSVTY